MDTTTGHRTVYWDTEDDSIELAEAGKSGLNKVCTQIAAIDSTGERFHLRPTVISRRKHGKGIVRHRWDVEPFLKWLAARGPHCTAWAHNTQYDLGNLWPDELDKFNVTMVGGRLVSARWDNVRFLDSANIFPMPLKKLGTSVGLEKLDTDARDARYLWRDVEIVERAIKLLDAMCEEYDAEQASTLGGLCVKFWHALGGYNWPCSLQPARDAYFGGRVEVFAPEMAGNLWYTDVNSLYPSTMLNKFPAGADLWFGLDDRERAESVLRDPSVDCWGVVEAELTIPEMDVAPLPVRHESGAVYYPVGMVYGWWTVHEVRNALAKGCVLRRFHCAYGSLEGEDYYANFVRHFYEQRRVEKDEGRKLMLKLLLNNLYGQLGMSGKVTRSLRLANHAVQLEDGEWHVTRDGVPYGDKLLADTQMPLADHVNWLHAAYVTSYGRLRLQHFLDRIPPEDLIYCDTDSIFFRAEEPPFPVSDVLGEMKLESRLTHAVCRSPKMYRITEEGKKPVTKVKGVPRKDSLPEKMFDEGKVVFRQPWKMRESIVAFNASTNGVTDKTKVLSVWRDVEKQIISNYDKKNLRNGRFLPKSHS